MNQLVTSTTAAESSPRIDSIFAKSSTEELNVRSTAAEHYRSSGVGLRTCRPPPSERRLLARASLLRDGAQACRLSDRGDGDQVWRPRPPRRLRRACAPDRTSDRDGVTLSNSACHCLRSPSSRSTSSTGSGKQSARRVPARVAVQPFECVRSHSKGWHGARAAGEGPPGGRRTGHDSRPDRSDARVGAAVLMGSDGFGLTNSAGAAQRVAGPSGR